MSLKDIFKKPELKGPQIVEVKSKPKKVAVASEIYDFSFNECRFGHYADKEGFFKSYPVAASLYGFFEFKNEEISKEELKDMLLDMTQNLEKIKEPENDFTQ